MNKLIGLLILTVAFSFSGLSQEYETETQLVESVLGQAKKNFVVDVVDIPEKNEEKFWSLYNKYEEDRKDMGRQRVKMVNEYLANKGMVKDNKEERFMNKVFSERHKRENLIKKYYKKMASQVSVKTASQFFQVEEYINTKIDNKMFEALPLNRHVGE